MEYFRNVPTTRSPINQSSMSFWVSDGNRTSSLTPNSGNGGDRSLTFDDHFKFPPGYRFRPLDYELIVNYLERKINNEFVPPNKIHDVNLYEHNPQTLSEKYISYGGKEWYFFTSRQRKYPKGQRPDRTADGGYWKATGADKAIKFNGDTVGYRKVLVFFTGKPPAGDKTAWIMHEYRVSNPPKTRVGGDMKLDDCVLCKIYQKDNKTTGVRRRSQDAEIDEIQDRQPESTAIANSMPLTLRLPVDQLNSDQATTSTDVSHPSDSKMSQPAPLEPPIYSMESSLMPEEYNQNLHNEEPWVALELNHYCLPSLSDLDFEQFFDGIESLVPNSSDGSIEPSNLANGGDLEHSDIH